MYALYDFIMVIKIKKSDKVCEDDYGRVIKKTKNRVTRKDAIYRGLPEKNARSIQRKFKRQGMKTEAVKNDYGTYDIYHTD